MEKEPRYLEGEGQYDYDYLNDIIFFKVKDRLYVKSIEMDNLIVDVDKENFIVGVQIFDASTFFGINKEMLRNVKNWTFNAKVEDNKLELKLFFRTVLRHTIIEPRPIIIQAFPEKEPLPNSEIMCSVA